MEILLVSLASLFAGMVDSIVGGGGLILIPALFATFPTAPPATLVGTNKSAAIWGTAFSTYQFSKKVEMRWAALFPAAAAGLLGSVCGAWTVTQVDPSFLRKGLPFLLLGLLIYTVAKREMGQLHQPRFQGRREALIAALFGLLIGFYDGIFGPGTGSFLMLILVASLGYAFITASAIAKVVNVATNVGAIMIFGFNGAVIWQIGIIMGVANISGAILGSRLAIKGGSTLVRKVFLIVTVALIIKVGIDTF
ncbi:MAG: hypothetical protein RIS02_740 [Pseudomonadota bacterium]